MMRWDWLCRDWLGHAMADDYWMFERAIPSPPRFIAPPPRHKTHALDQHYQKPVVRAHLGQPPYVRQFHPHSLTPPRKGAPWKPSASPPSACSSPSFSSPPPLG